MNENLLEKDHPLNLGKIIGNLQTIEMLARLYLVKKAADGDLRKARPNIATLKKCDQVEITPISDPKSLKSTLEAYNRCVELALKVDIDKIVFLRDALAHGRVFGRNGHNKIGSSPLRLLKFSKENAIAGKVNVTLCVDMTEEWFCQQRNFLNEEIAKMTNAIGFAQTPLAKK